MGNQLQKDDQQSKLDKINDLLKNHKHLQKYKDQCFILPDESMPHDATWLQWPHAYQYGNHYVKKLDPIWVQLTKELSESQTVKIIVFDENQKIRVSGLLPQNIQNVQFFIHPTDDVWIRDNGPFFVRDHKLKLSIQNWGFNGWGKKADYQNCQQIPELLSFDIKMQLINLRKIMILQGGAIQVDGQGVLITTQSSVLNKNRNPQLTKPHVQALFAHFFGIKRVIWLKGKAGIQITDMHIDGFVKFFDPSTIITMNQKDLKYCEVPQEDINTLHKGLKTLDNEYYQLIQLPLTKNNVKSTKKSNLGKGSYVNFYVANSKVLVPNYGDPNDQIVNEMIKKLYPYKKVVGIKINDLFQQGGMIHCVTLHQPKQ